MEHVLLHDIRHHAKTAVKDEQSLIDRLLAFSGEACKNESAAIEKALRDTESRMTFVESAGKQLFEERVGGVKDIVQEKIGIITYDEESRQLKQVAKASYIGMSHEKKMWALLNILKAKNEPTKEG